MPLSPSQTRQILDQLGHRARRNLGQNFLIDGNIVRKSLHLAEVSADDRVLEVGPGLGTLTTALLEAGAVVHAIELDATLAQFLRDTLVQRFPHTFHLKEADAVDYPRADLQADPAHEDFKVIANLPYAITTPWIEGLLAEPLPSQLVLMMQKEAADRLTAQPGTKNYGAISIFLAAAYRKAGTFPVSRSCFYPVPGVDSQLLHLRRCEQPQLLAPATRDLIRKLFTQRRKQIGTLLGKTAHCHDWLDQLQGFGAARSDRPEDIPLAAWLSLDSIIKGADNTD